MKRMWSIIVMTLAMMWASSTLALLEVKKNKTYGHIYIVYHHVDVDIKKYKPLITALQKAKSGDRIYILVTNNLGGAVSTLSTLTHHIAQSKAFVIMESKGLNASAAALLVLQGDVARLRHGSTLLFHNIRYKGKNGNLIIPSRKNRGTPLKLQTYYATLRWFKRVRLMSMLTESQWSRVIDGEDVRVMGKAICDRGSKTRVVLSRSTFCLIRGAK